MRIRDMRGVNIAKYRFDFDLTFGVLAVNADGTVYHRYGGRDSRAPGHWTTADSFERMLRASLERHRTRPSDAAAPKLEAPLRTESIPAYAKRDQGACIHCHNVHESLQYEARDQGTWTLDDIWVFPEPARFGLDLDRDDQRKLVIVEEHSPAAAAGLQVNDTLLALGGTPIASASDVMHVADGLPMEGGELEVRFLRAGAEMTTKLSLSPGWKRGSAASFAWRPLKWTLDPVPGFGGPEISAAQRSGLKLPEGEFAFRIQYFVTWGPRAAYGKRAQQAGLRQGDVVVEVAGKRDFESQDHFHAWWRLTRKPGDVVEIRVLRDGKPLEFELWVTANEQR